MNGSVSFSFQCSLLAITTAILLITVYPLSQRFNAYERAPSLIHHTDGYEHSKPIDVGMYIDNFLETDLAKGEFTFEGTVWFKYPTGSVPLEMVKEFSLDHGDITQKSYLRSVTHDGHQVDLYGITAKCHIVLDYRSYPLDDHNLFITLKNDSLNPEKYHFIASNEGFDLSAHAAINNFSVMAQSMVAGYKPAIVFKQTHALTKTIIESPCVLLSLSCRRIDWRHIVNLLLPLLFIFFVAVFAYSIIPSEHNTDALGLTVASIPALFAHRFVMESFMPETGYFVCADYLFFIFFIACLLSFYGLYWSWGKSTVIKQMIVAALYCFIISGCIGVLLLSNP